ncbi:MAG TPA: sigma-70 family RNA polymerase sigma factor [Methylomirabilota bacterium]|nr:sigma-70 family RNA polymerase sigma factor [Methylomirabilota bacterium]
MVDERDPEETLQAATATPRTDPIEWLEPVYREHSRAVIQAAYRVTGNAEDAEDVLQTVFTRLARRSAPPDFSGGALPYLRRAAVNAALDLVQSKRARTSVPFDDATEAVTGDPSPPPDRLQHGRELHDKLREVVAGLSRRSAEIFTLRYIEGLDNQAVAAALGTSPGTVAVTLHRVRERLKTEMAPFLGGIR